MARFPRVATGATLPLRLPLLLVVVLAVLLARRDLGVAAVPSLGTGATPAHSVYYNDGVNYAMSQFEKGAQCVADDDYLCALEAFLSVISFSPALIEGHLNFGNCMEHTNKIEHALAVYHSAHLVDPSHRSPPNFYCSAAVNAKLYTPLSAEMCRLAALGHPEEPRMQQRYDAVRLMVLTEQARRREAEEKGEPFPEFVSPPPPVHDTQEDLIANFMAATPVNPPRRRLESICAAVTMGCFFDSARIVCDAAARDVESSVYALGDIGLLGDLTLDSARAYEFNKRAVMYKIRQVEDYLLPHKHSIPSLANSKCDRHEFVIRWRHITNPLRNYPKEFLDDCPRIRAHNDPLDRISGASCFPEAGEHQANARIRWLGPGVTNVTTTRLCQHGVTDYDMTAKLFVLQNTYIEGPSSVLYDDCHVYSGSNDVLCKVPEQFNFGLPTLEQMTGSGGSPLSPKLTARPGEEIVNEVALPDNVLALVNTHQSGNYYHFTAEVLPRLLLFLNYTNSLPRNSKYANPTFVIPDGNKVALNYLQLLKVPANRVVRHRTQLKQAPKDEVIEGDKPQKKKKKGKRAAAAAAPSAAAAAANGGYKPRTVFSNRIFARELMLVDWELDNPDIMQHDTYAAYLAPPAALRMTRRHFAWPYRPENERNLIIYVSRQDAGFIRVVHNEDRLTAALMQTVSRIVVHEDAAPFEFVKFVAGPGISIEYQMSLFSRAAVVIGPHGAGMTNIIWSAPGTAVIEFPTLPNANGVFGFMSLALGHNHWLVPEMNTCYYSAYELDVERIKNIVSTLHSALGEVTRHGQLVTVNESMDDVVIHDEIAVAQLVDPRIIQQQEALILRQQDRERAEAAVGEAAAAPVQEAPEDEEEEEEESAEEIAAELAAEAEAQREREHAHKRKTRKFKRQEFASHDEF
ncbi:hypothetical protein CAOG_02406 [Capsaspora owczarzaki ATCC 30864]|uniref:Glycosyltransferase 61 catalytic domain-containing protein n=1 Tax=Capsaspora owczarzaki (strain ATCC 30864) TaxID=595528 RepID=A0A0D2U814_CAPO3|nr:hypothetical protein CAOG_02406 [Capsaspora owczarzaki ATCC 30864]KJE91241.1 hypothetical protein CAOG_002406 [Capsaspora owczarzaki ATCC 30864]|eukprot:XP_004349156.1 hypothetical protein CAOG_02406 [Capsaspora owczarzaki ATCC 30864]